MVTLTPFSREREKKKKKDMVTLNLMVINFVLLLLQQTLLLVLGRSISPKTYKIIHKINYTQDSDQPVIII